MSKMNYPNIKLSFHPHEKPVVFRGKIHYPFSVETGSLKTKAQMPIPRASSEVT